ncbi:hypothetical protein LAZ67_8000179 [Cordylochernes scorpioides]|uniref:Alpha-latrotoxin n=1 Tax=Cordylochernes scorpioides TaxID=51811 RepID=A0ABY6KPM6_9ARAC|nr:hypothetical protein LAZ67_8000179 [Cordylochernes scorpioides]
MFFLVETEDENDLKEYFEDIKNPFNNDNLVIFICKHNRADILNYLFEVDFNLLQKLPLIPPDRMTLLETDQNGHNAFYYAIRSRNVNLVEILINKWPNSYDVCDPEELSEFIADAYSELKIKNVLLSEEMDFFVANKLISINFFSNESIQNKTAENVSNIKERIALVLKNIDQIKDEYQHLDVDEKFLYIITFIAKNIHILKGELKSTYAKIPWEEIEFFLVTFTISYKTQKEINFFYRATLNKSKILHYLDIFAEIIKENQHLIAINIKKSSPNSSREKVIQDLIKNHPQLEQFYTDYQQVRDVTSLEKMNVYLKYVASMDPNKKLGKLVITRTMQIVGEHLKNSLESPKLSSLTIEHILLLLPKNTRRLITGLRDSLSHAQSLSKRTEIENNSDSNFLKGIQADVKKFSGVVEDIFYLHKIKTSNVLLKKMAECENHNQLKEIANIFKNVDLLALISNNKTSHQQFEVDKFIDELFAIIPDKTYFEIELLKRMKEMADTFKSNKGQSADSYLKKISCLVGLSTEINEDVIRYNEIRGIKYFTTKALKSFAHRFESRDLKELVELTNLILNSTLSRNLDPNTNDKIYQLTFKIFQFVQFEIDDYRYIEKLGEKLSDRGLQNEISKTSTHTQPSINYDSQLTLKLFDLKNILGDNSFSFCEKVANEFCSFRANEKLQAAVEMLVLDSFSILDTSRKCLVNNILSIDNPAPFLLGRSLRNHLAHENILLDLISDTRLALAINAHKLLSENISESKKKIGRLAVMSLSSTKTNFEQGLVVVETQKRMFEALQEGDMEKLASCLKEGADLNARSINARTTLHFAALGQSLEIVKFLLDQNIDPKAQDASGQSPLHLAALKGSSMLVEFLLKKGLDVNCVDNYGKTPAHLASQNGHLDSIKILYKYGAKTSYMDSRGLTVLCHAIFHNHIDIVKFILTQEPHVDCSVGRCGFNSLHTASEKGFLEIVNYLIHKNTNVNAKNDKKWTALHAASSNGHLKIVEVLILNGANVNAKWASGATPLQLATENGNLEIINVLLKNGAQVNAADKYDRAPLHYAAKDGHENIAKTLLKHNAHIDILCFKGTTPLHLAAAFGWPGLIQILLDHGATIDIKNKAGATALHLAAYEGRKDAAICLIKNGAAIDTKRSDGKTPLFAAVSSGNNEIFKILVENNANVNVKSKDGDSLLHTAALLGNKEVLDILLENNANINAITLLGDTPLHLASKYGHKDTVTNLIKKKAKINEKNVMDMTPLHNAILGNHKQVCDVLFKKLIQTGTLLESASLLNTAVMAGNKEAIKALINNGTDVNGKYQNVTPLGSAIAQKNKEIVQFLIANGANVNAKDGYLLRKAIYDGSREIVDILLKNNASVNIVFKTQWSTAFENESSMNSPILQKIKNSLPQQFTSYYKENKIYIKTKGEPLIDGDIAERNSNIDRQKDTTPLHLASRMGDERIVQALISHGAKVNVSIDQKLAPLHIASYEGHEDVVRILLENGASINATSIFGTPLHFATTNGQINVVRILLDYKANINLISSTNARPVELAVRIGHLAIVKALLEHPQRIDVNTRGEGEFTLLHIASQEDFIEIVKYLVLKGADVHARNSAGSKPIHIAAREGRLDVVKYFLGLKMSINDFGLASQTMLHYASIAGHLEVVKYLVEMGADINARDESGLDPLQYANIFNHQTLVEYLLKRGATSTKMSFLQLPKMTGASASTPPLESTQKLFRALKQNNALGIEDAIKAGAVVNARNEFSKTPLHLASYKGYVKIVELLLQNKADPKLLDDKSMTPLHYAAEASHLRVVELLLSHGAIYNATAKGNDGIPCQYTSDKSISFLFKLLEDSFEHIKNGREQVIRDLNKLSDVRQVRAVMCANNKKQETLIVCAMKRNFPKVNCLKEILQKNVSARINNALLSISQCRYQEGLKILNKVHEERRDILGSENPGTWDIKLHIADGLYKQGSLLEALDLIEELFRKQRDTLGFDFEDTLRTRSFQALVLHSLNRYEEALNIFKEVSVIQEKLLGAHHDDVLETQFHTGLVLLALNKYDEALSIFRKFYEMRKKTMGANSPHVLVAQNNIALALFGQGKYEESLKMFLEVYEKRRIVLGDEHADTLRTLQKIGTIYVEQKKEYEALKVYADLLKVQKKVFGPMHPDTLNTQYFLGTLYMSQGKMNSALGELSSCLDGMRKIYGPNNSYSLNAQKYLELVQEAIKAGDSQREHIQHKGLYQLLPPLHLAANIGSLKEVTDLLKNGADTNSQDSEGTTPLHHAVDILNTAIVNILLQNGADVTLATNKGNTPLHTATIRGSKENAELLLKDLSPEKLKEFVNAKTKGRGLTALHVATERGYIEMVLTLLGHRAMYNIPDKNGKTPVDLAKDKDIVALLTLMEDLFKDAKAGNMDLIKKLKAVKPVLFNALTKGCNSQDKTLLQVAIANKNKSLAGHLITLMKQNAE